MKNIVISTFKQLSGLSDDQFNLVFLPESCIALVFIDQNWEMTDEVYDFLAEWSYNNGVIFNYYSCDFSKEMIAHVY